MGTGYCRFKSPAWVPTKGMELAGHGPARKPHAEPIQAFDAFFVAFRLSSRLIPGSTCTCACQAEMMTSEPTMMRSAPTASFQVTLHSQEDQAQQNRERHAELV